METLTGILLTALVLLIIVGIILAASSDWGSAMDDYMKKLEDEDNNK